MSTSINPPQINPIPQLRSLQPQTSGAQVWRCRGTGRPTTAAAPCRPTTWRSGTPWSRSGSSWCPATAPPTTSRLVHKLPPQDRKRSGSDVLTECLRFQNLLPERQYKFRVRAQNIYGIGEPSAESEPVTVGLVDDGEKPKLNFVNNFL